jgi:cupin 2 domain-containing protein
MHGDLAADIPAQLPEELTTVLARGRGVRIERIVSRGQVSPAGFWYDQAEDEFVLLVAGEARVQIEDQAEQTLLPGQWIHLAAHVRHRVTFTAADRDTIWLAVFYQP